MTDRTTALRVGIVLLAAGFITGFMIILLGEGRSMLQGRYTVHIRFPDAPGVAVDTPVRKNGVLIGRVSHVELRDEPGMERGVMISARIDSGRKIYKDEVCQIRSSSLLGDAVLEFVRVPGSTQPSEPFQDGDFVGDGQVSSDPLKAITSLEGDVRRAVNSFEGAANNFSQLTSRLQRSLGTDDNQLQRLAQKSETALDQLQRTARVFEDLVGDPDVAANLKQGVRELPKTLQDLQMLVASTRETLDGFKGMQDRVAENLDSLKKFTGPLGEQGEEMVGNVNKIVENVESMTAIGADLAERIRTADGSLARFIREDDLYDTVMETVNNIKDASRQLRPILNDARVISDKLARDPGGELGLKRALENRPVGAGIKGSPPNVRGLSWPWPVEE